MCGGRLRCGTVFAMFWIVAGAVLVVSGLLNKQVGGELGISEITVKAHRGQVMRKMKAGSLPELVNMVAGLGLLAPRFPYLSLAS